MEVLHLLTSGGVGGIEVLCKDIGLNSTNTKQVFAFLFGEGKIYERMKAEGCYVYSLEKFPKLSFVRLKQLISIAKSSSVIVVHHDDPFLEMYYLLLKNLLPKKKYVSMVHHCYNIAEDMERYGFLKRTIKKYIQKKMFRISNRIVFDSKAGCQSYDHDFSIPVEKSIIIYNGISNGKLMAGKMSIKEKKEKPMVLYAGRLEKIKGVDILLKAISFIPQNQFKLTIVGDGKEKNKLMETCKEQNINNVEFIGFQDDINPWLNQADIFVYPSRMEIFGISVVEALAFQCICVVNNVGGMPEIIKDNENGIINTQNDEEGLARCIQKALNICNEQNQRESMMTNAFNTAMNFSIDHTIHHLELLFEELINET